MTCEVKVILDSRNRRTGTRLTTLQLRYWRAIHAEFMTHRVFSRNAGSSRATPVKKMLAQVWNDPAGPVHWGANQAGMQAAGELTGWKLWLARKLWRGAAKVACVFAWGFMKVGLHKQVANRILEPWQYINVVVSATDWDNFFHLRAHADAQPEIQELARAILGAMAGSGVVDLEPGEWHIPYLLPGEEHLDLATKLKVSTARCARVSYQPFDGTGTIEKDMGLHDRLVASDPIHASPTEHQAVAMHGDGRMANFDGFIQYRHYIEMGTAL